MINCAPGINPNNIVVCYSRPNLWWVEKAHFRHDERKEGLVLLALYAVEIAALWNLVS